MASPVLWWGPGFAAFRLGARPRNLSNRLDSPGLPCYCKHMIHTPTTTRAIREAMSSRTGRGYMALSDIMEFDRVIQIHEDGSVTDAPGVYGPERLEHGENGRGVDPYGLLGDWTLFTDGYTGQYGYSGPIMHNSEYIGGRLAEDILDTPGFYVALVCYWPDDEDTTDEDREIDGDYAEGWAIARLDG